MIEYYIEMQDEEIQELRKEIKKMKEEIETLKEEIKKIKEVQGGGIKESKRDNL